MRRAFSHFSGYELVLGAVLCNGATYHLVKAGLRHGTPAVSVAVGGFSVFLGFLLAGWLARRFGAGHTPLGQVRLTSVLGTVRAHGRHVIGAAVVGSTGGWLLVQTVDRFGPEMAAFLANLTLVFLILGGVLLGERLRRTELATIALIIAGAFLFTFKGGTVRWAALGLMAPACACTATKQLLAKTVVGRTNRFAGVAALNGFMALWACLLGVCSGTLRLPPPASLAFFVAGGLLGSMIGMTLLYSGYIRLGVARGAPLDAMRPLVVLLIGLGLGTPWPGTLQVVGALLVLAGSAALGLQAGNPKRSG